MRRNDLDLLIRVTDRPIKTITRLLVRTGTGVSFAYQLLLAAVSLVCIVTAGLWALLSVLGLPLP